MKSAGVEVIVPSGQATAGSVPKKAPDLVDRKIAGEYLLVPVRGNLADLQRIYALSPVAEHIWLELDRLTSLDEVRRSIVERFDVSEQEAGGDLLEFLAELRAAGLLVG